MCAVGFPVGFFFVGLSMIKGSAADLFDGCTIMVLCVLCFFAGIYGCWLQSERQQQLSLQAELAEHEAEHLLRYDRPIDSMADYQAYLLNEESNTRMQTTRTMLRVINSRPEINYQRQAS